VNKRQSVLRRLAWGLAVAGTVFIGDPAALPAQTSTGTIRGVVRNAEG
jgi:hypothetical protein